MRFRSHVLRSFDLGLWSNRAVLTLTVLAFVVGLGLVLIGDESPWLPLVAAGATFVAWGLARELDPDRDVTATVAGALTAVWALLGFEVALLPLAGMLLAGRLLLESTGRRPLLTDLAVIALAATLISFTPAGWVAGFGLALAIYFDDRMADEPSGQAIIVAIAAALGASAVATLTGAFPQELPEVGPSLALAMGLLALLAVAREPPDPTSQVDSRRKTFLIGERLHASRVAVALILFGAVLLSGDDGAALVPGAIVLSLSLASSEVERIQRSR